MTRRRARFFGKRRRNSIEIRRFAILWRGRQIQQDNVRKERHPNIKCNIQREILQSAYLPIRSEFNLLTSSSFFLPQWLARKKVMKRWSRRKTRTLRPPMVTMPLPVLHENKVWRHIYLVKRFGVSVASAPFLVAFRGRRFFHRLLRDEKERVTKSDKQIDHPTADPENKLETSTTKLKTSFAVRNLLEEIDNKWVSVDQ